MLKNKIKIKTPSIKAIISVTIVFICILSAYMYIDRERIALSIINHNPFGIEVEARKVSISFIPKFAVMLDDVKGTKVGKDNFYLFTLPHAILEMPFSQLFSIILRFPDSKIPKNISIRNDSTVSVIPNNTQSEKEGSRIWKGLKFNASAIDVSWTDVLIIKMTGEINPNESSHLLYLQGEIQIKSEESAINVTIQNSRDSSDTVMIAGKISPDLALHFKSKIGNINDWGLDFFNLGPIRASGKFGYKPRSESLSMSDGFLYLGDGENNGIQIKGGIDDKQSCEFDLEGGGENIAKLFVKPIHKVDLNGTGFKIKASLGSAENCITNPKLKLSGNLDISNFNLAHVGKEFVKGAIGIQANFSSSASNLKDLFINNLSGNGHLKLKADLNVAHINSFIHKEFMNKAPADMKDTVDTVIPILPKNDSYFRCTYTPFKINRGVVLSGDNNYPWMFETNSMVINTYANLDLGNLSYSLSNKVAMGSSSNWRSLKGDFVLKGNWDSKPDQYLPGFEEYVTEQVKRKELSDYRNKSIMTNPLKKLVGEAACTSLIGVKCDIPQDPREDMKSCL